MTVGLYGGAFDPPHNGHVAAVRGALEQLELDRLLVLVSERPGHRAVVSEPAARLALAAAAFSDLPRVTVELDPFARTVDLLRARPGLVDPVVIIGADQFVAFSSWKEPEDVLGLARLAVARRPGVDDGRVDAVLRRLRGRERVQRFAIEQVPVSSSQLRARAARGESLDAFVPPRVAALVRELGLYGSASY